MNADIETNPVRLHPEWNDLIDRLHAIPKPSDGFYECNPWLEKADRIGVPLIPPHDAPKKADPNPVVAICGECGREVHQMEWYYCANGRCPIQIKLL